MLEFRQTMDQHARDVVWTGDEFGPRGQRYASIQWHPHSAPRVVFYVDIMLSVDLSELKQIIARLEYEEAAVREAAVRDIEREREKDQAANRA